MINIYMEDKPEYKVEVKPDPWYVKLWDWFVDLFTDDDFELTVWYVYETQISDGGLKAIKRQQREYQLSSLSKCTNTHIKGKDLDKKDFEIKTVEPFDYEIRRIK